MKPKPRPTLLPDDEYAWRRQHDPIERVADVIDQRTGQPITIIDSDGNRGSPYRSVGLLTSMARNGRITMEERCAGEEFHEQFIIAGHQPLRAADPGRVGCGGAAPAYRGSAKAQERVHGALESLGGMFSRGGSCVWYVLGEEHSLTAWAGAERERGRMISTQDAAGILICSLGVLQKYFGY